MNLRPYQARLVGEVRGAYAKGARSVLMQLPTGGGKTATAAEIIRLAVERGRRVLFLAHLDTLVEDTRARLVDAGVRAGVVQAGRPEDVEAPAQVCSLATLHVRGVRPPADLVIVDECHRALAASVRGILEGYPKAHVLGLTATPQRGDNQPLSDCFERLVCGPSVRSLMAQGHLVACDVVAPPSYLDEGLATTPADAWEKHTPGQRAIVFAANVAHAEETARGFRDRGVSAELVTGETSSDVRASVRGRMTSGDLTVLVGVAVFLEGFDLPAIESVILARAFGTCGAFLQAIGRGLRPSPATGKTRCTVLDLRGAVNLHGLPDEDRVWSLDGVAVRRTEALPALRHCAECWAIFRPAPKCPRCGAVAVAAPRVPRSLNRAEILERVSALPEPERDARYLASLERVASTRMKMPEAKARRWAREQFMRRFGRAAA